MINSNRSKKYLLFLTDLALLYISLVLAVWIGFGEQFSLSVLYNHLLPFSLIFIAWIIIFYILGFYDNSSFKIDQVFFFKLGLGLGLAFILSTSFFYLLPFTISPRTNLVVSTASFGLFFVTWRSLASRFFSRRLVKKTVFVGESPEAQILREKLESDPHFGYQVVPLSPNGNFLSQLQAAEVNTVIAGKDLEEIKELEKNIYQILSSKLELLDLSQAYENTLEKIPASFITKTWFLKNIRESGKGVYERIKRLKDFLLSLLLLALTVPLWPLIALAIKLQDRGRVFYKQERVGRNNRTFKLIKFRTMREDAEKQGALWAKENDPRVTKIGRLLRFTHLDELPQLINIFKGELSFVGPRPERPEFVRELEEKIPHYRLRHVIKPGVTGWAQIKFRYARSIEDSQEKFEYDLFYLKNRSLLLDIGIILKTAQKFFSK